jgi:hypothetical protein
MFSLSKAQQPASAKAGCIAQSSQVKSAVSTKTTGLKVISPLVDDGKFVVVPRPR